MSLLTEASLIVTPNAYNVGKLYSVIPNTTLGDMDVSRGSSATRVNEQKLIEIARTNLVLYSEQFNQANWTKAATTVTANATTAPDGTSTADNVVPSATTAFHSVRQSISVTPSISHTFSVYAKANGYTKVALADGATGGFAARFDLSAESVISTIIGTTATITNVGSGWYRLTATFTTTAFSTPSITGYPTGATLNNFGASFTGDGTSGVFLWGAQIEAGETATDYIPTTTSIRTKFAGITQDGGFGSDIPRIDYPPLGGCPSILVEPARTNQISYSEQFDNAAWTNNNTIITANATATLAPDGTFTADKFIPNVVNTVHSISRTTALTSDAYTFSVFAKAGEETTFSMWLRNANFGAVFDLSTGTSTSIYPSIIHKIEPYPNGWYRCSVYDATAGTTANIYGRTGGSFQGNNVNGFFLWGAQAEAGSYASSYIPTVAGTVTRTADSSNTTGLSSLIGQLEGTIYAEILVKQITQDYLICALSLTGQSVANSVVLTVNNIGKLVAQVYASNVSVVSIVNPTAFVVGDIYKVAFGYKSGNSVLFVNGGQVSTTDTDVFNLTTLNAVSLVNTGYYVTGGQQAVKSIVLFKTRLTDDQCILLTGPSFSSYPEMASALIYTLQ